MSICIIKPGLCDTFQDVGRFGYQHLGINPTGAMDQNALQVANALTGNPLNQAVLEMHFPAAVILFENKALVALAGADFHAHVNGQTVPVNQPLLIQKKSVLSFAQPRYGARVYCSVHGGFQLQQWLHSYSTNTVCTMGGYYGRALQAGDTIALNKKVDYTRDEQWPIIPLPFSAVKLPWQTPGVLQVLPGAQYHLLNAESKQQLINQPFTIAAQSNRMGYRLQAAPLTIINNTPLVSNAVSMGTVQLLPNGQLVVLMADHQTTGGYPVVANIVTSNLPHLAQCRSGDNIRLNLCTPAYAYEALLQQRRHLLQLQNACTFRLRQFV